MTARLILAPLLLRSNNIYTFDDHERVGNGRQHQNSSGAGAGAERELIVRHHGCAMYVCMYVVTLAHTGTMIMH